ncbi:histidine phosphatase family protein [Gorillibacterium timonense]|uniref:histidine phosphatase family protein n=1 Tax=Gorillibacterium timonense TaxID=1689269 RepID=UPI00071D7D1B|nr:histidine phosphatase family protein [Gorillibacterium timonense]
MNTYLYMVRHGESLKTEGNERTRGLTDKGWADVDRITNLLKEEGIDAFVSSPYRRAVLTIEGLAQSLGKEITVYEELRELNFISENQGIADQDIYPTLQKMFADPSYSLPGGESNAACLERSVAALKDILQKHKGQKIVVGTHGLIMTLMMGHFDSQYGLDFLLQISKPDVYRLEFKEDMFIGATRLWKV